MGRSQEKDRKRRQAAATCQRLDGFLVPKRARDQLVTPDPDFTQVAVDDQLTPTSSECCNGSVERVGSSSTATYWQIVFQNQVSCRFLQVHAGSGCCGEVQPTDKSQKASCQPSFSSGMYWWPQPSFSSCLAIRTPVDGLQRASGWCLLHCLWNFRC